MIVGITVVLVGFVVCATLAVLIPTLLFYENVEYQINYNKGYYSNDNVTNPNLISNNKIRVITDIDVGTNYWINREVNYYYIYYSVDSNDILTN